MKKRSLTSLRTELFISRIVPFIFLLTLLIAGYVLLSQRRTPTEELRSYTSPKAEVDKTGAIFDSATDLPGSNITIEQELPRKSNHTPYVVSYQSDGLKIYAAMNVPDGEGTFPVIVLNHGYYNTSSFTTGDGTAAMADILASEGYITLASDYRGHGRSENDTRRAGGHRPEYATDVLNLIASVKNVSKADRNRIGMWGHSMGGEVSLRVANMTNNITAIVLWAPSSINPADNHAFYGGGRNRNSAQNDKSDATIPINSLRNISAPISLHQGLEDSEVDPNWSKNLNLALKNAGKSIEYFEYEGQDHNFRNRGWGEISGRTLSFFDKYVKNN